MASQWDNFLRNLGEWRGTFCGLAADGSIADTTASILTLQAGDEERLVHFRLRRFGPEGVEGEPIHEMAQDYRNLGKQVVFFDNGTFCKGSMQVSPCAEFGGEFGFVDQDRRHRLVQLHAKDGRFSKLVLIREFRTDGTGQEQPPASLESLAGEWSGQASTISADWPEPSLEQAAFQITTSDSQGFSIRNRSVSSRANSPVRCSRAASGVWTAPRNSSCNCCPTLASTCGLFRSATVRPFKWRRAGCRLRPPCNA